MIQSEMFEADKGTIEKFLDWKDTRGGGMIMADLYAIAAGYVKDWQATGIPVSMKLIFEIERHKMKMYKAGVQKKGDKYEKIEGYSLNNNFTAYAADHMIGRRPDWNGLFETRERRAN